MPEFHSTHHGPTARERAKAKRVRRQKAVNRQEATFGRINWDTYQHRELWDMVQSAQPADLGEQARRWTDLAGKVDAATGGVHSVVQKLLMSWRGPSSVQAAGSVQNLTSWAGTAGQNAWRIGDGLDDYTSVISEARHRMPEPVHYWAERWFDAGYAVKRLDGPEGTYMLDQLLDDQLPTKKQADEAKAEAVRVMEQYEGASHDVRHRLPPEFDTAPPVTAAGAPAWDSGKPPGPPTGGPGEPGPSRTDPPWTGPPGPDPSPPGPGGFDPPGRDPSWPGPGDGRDSTSTTSVVPGALTGALAPGAGGWDGSGGAGSSGGPNGSGTGSGPGGIGGVGPGGAGPGGGALGEGARAGTGRGSGYGTGGFGPGGAGARGGGAGGYGMYPPGQGARREEDTEHHDKYAGGYDLMDDLPPAYPPVFGE